MAKDRTITIEEMVRKDPALAHAFVRGWERKVFADDRAMCSFDYFKNKWVAPVQYPKSLGELCLEIATENADWIYMEGSKKMRQDIFNLRHAMYRRNK
jgi:hypothetical protein